MIRVPAGFGGEDRIKRYLDYYQPSYGVMMLSAGQFSPASLFAAGEQGAWYDPSDFTTMFQDSAGTTPVTAVEQPVGRILDKSGRGNHATQSTSASRPVLSARVNLLLQSQNYTSTWILTATTVTSTNNADPIGGSTATLLTEGISTSGPIVSQDITAVANTIHTFSVPIKRGDTDWVRTTITNTGASNFLRVWFNLATGALGSTNTLGTVANTSSSITDLGSGWYRCTISCSIPDTTVRVSTCSATANGSTSRVTNSTRLQWGADLRVTNDGVGLPAYQRVTTSTDYDTTGFPYYLFFDGTDDSLATSTFTPGTDKVQVFAGVRKNRDTGVNGALVETSVSGGVNAGSITVWAPDTTGAYFFRSRGSSASGVGASSPTSYPAPITNILTGLGDIAGDSMLLRLNGIQVGSNSSDQGTGNFLAYPLYIGRRGGTTLPLNGRIYSLILRFGPNLDATTISNTETWVNGKTMAY
jgi:hypothetical protein